MEVEIISRECIKPTSPTPHHLRTYKLSLFDQFIPAIYVPMVLFYPKNQGSSQNDTIPKRSQLLKRSLSQTLNRYYPLAGKMKNDLSIDCNDEGDYYVEARLKCHLAEFLSPLPDLSLMHRFLPSDPSENRSTIGAHLAMIQVNVFDCGGIAIGASVLHVIVDGISLSRFLKDWAATARGCCEAECPDFSAPALFPQNDSLPTDSIAISMWRRGPLFKTGKPITKRFVFDAAAIAALKAKATTSWVQNPTRVEVVSALIWKCTMAAFKAKPGVVPRPCLLTHAVNLRRRAVPPFSEYFMGNFLWTAAAQCTAEAETTELHQLVRELREAISKINVDFLRTTVGDEGFFKICEALEEMGEFVSSIAMSNNGVDFLGFSSWCNFGLFEVDFGWGKPMWATCGAAASGNSVSVVFLNFVVLMDTRWGDGMEALVTLDEQDMAVLERDVELLTFASLDPSPLQLSHA